MCEPLTSLKDPLAAAFRQVDTIKTLLSGKGPAPYLHLCSGQAAELREPAGSRLCCVACCLG